MGGSMRTMAGRGTAAQGMTGRRSSPLLAALMLLAVMLCGAGAMAQTPAADAQRARVDALRADIQQIETALGARELTDAELQRFRATVVPMSDELRGLADELGARADQARQRLEQLGAKPAAGAPAESADIASERGLREKALAEADEAAKLSRALVLQADQIVSSVGDRRRALFARTLFERGPSLINLELWGTLLGSLPQDLRALNLLISDWLAAVFAALSGKTALLVLIAAAAAVGLYVARLRYLPRIMASLGGDADATRLKRLLAAVVRLAAGTLPAAVGSWLLYSGLLNAGLLPRRIEPFAWSVLGGLAFLAFMGALADATLAPKWPMRRVFGVADRNARILKKMVASAALVLVISKAVEALLQAIAAGLSLSIVSRGVFALVFAGVVAWWLNKLRDTSDETAAADLGPYVPVDGALLAPLRLVGWTLVVAIGGAALFGYTALASFLVEQSAWALIVVTLLMLALMLADEGLQTLLAGGGKVSAALQTNVGLRKRSLEQAAVLGAGLIKLVLLVIGVMLILAPWGIESTDLTSSLKAAFFGFKVGDVTISLSAIIIAGLLFALGITATKALQRWLDERFLPATELDTGLRNSLKTMAGYVGFLAALALAISSLGLSLERLTIVAGALSVGIGFGLQSIVSNFVSGLILLWERPIRVGDLIVVGDGEGVVKRINVRSTEIETFDRSTVIVPNSNLISGVVKNRVRQDRTGRVIVSLSVPRAIDPERVREVMVAAASRHPDVLNDPPPRVMFKRIGEASLDFDLICVVPEVDTAGRVSSDLHFAIFASLGQHGIGQPEREVSVKGLDRIEDTLEELVDTMEEVQETQAAVLAGRRPKVAAAEPATREPAPPLADARPQRAGARKS
jgi:small-conductance mechanosensitive channel